VSENVLSSFFQAEVDDDYIIIDII